MDISFDAEETPYLSFPHSLPATAMDNSFEDYNLYWETNTVFQTQDLDDSWELDPFIIANFDTSSSDGATLSPVVASKNIVSERNRRKKLNDRLLALRGVVPNITKMDKSSIIKDAIKYIQKLHEEENKIQEEIRELENRRLIERTSWDLLDDYPLPLVWFRSEKEKEKSGQSLNSDAEKSSPIDVLDLSVTNWREKTVVVKLRCRNRRRTTVKICQIFESLKLKVMTSTITYFSDTLVKTAFIEGDGEEMESLKQKIEAAIESHNHIHKQQPTGSSNESSLFS